MAIVESLPMIAMAPVLQVHLPTAKRERCCCCQPLSHAPRICNPLHVCGRTVAHEADAASQRHPIFVGMSPASAPLQRLECQAFSLESMSTCGCLWGMSSMQIAAPGQSHSQGFLPKPNFLLSVWSHLSLTIPLSPHCTCPFNPLIQPWPCIR
jgi:hypothetical protein